MILNRQIVLIMPTKSELLYPVRKGRKVQGDCPLLSLRPLSPDKDMTVIYKWINEDCGAQLPLMTLEPDLFREAYSSILASDAAQIFIGMVDDSPICEIELYKVRQHVISLSYESRPGDYYLDLLSPPSTPHEHMTELLSNSLEYFFSFGEINRIMAEADIKNEWMNALLKSAGFHLYKRVSVPYKNSNFYFCSRRSLML
jgi:acetyl CoA:N6-hydroxylysine acetyl transferase